MKILALDASTKSTGWALFEDTALVDYGCVTATNADVIDRIKTIQIEIEQVLTKYLDIQKIIVEEVRPEQGLQNLKTHKALMYLQAAIAFLAHQSNIKLETIYPNSWRKQCGIDTGPGKRRADLKPADIAFVKETFNISVNDDIADAIGIGYAYTSNFSAW